MSEHSSDTTPIPEKASTSAPPRRSTKYAADGLVTLLIGPEQDKLVVNGHWLAKSSAFFRAALKKEWKEGKERVIALPEESTEHAELYLDFVFGNALPTDHIQDYEQLSLDLPFPTLFDLYIFGERVLNASIRNAVITETIRLMALEDDRGDGWIPDWVEAASIYPRTPPTSPLREFIVDVLVQFGKPEDMEGLDLRDCTEVALDVVAEFSRRAMGGGGTRWWREKELRAENYFV